MAETATRTCTFAQLLEAAKQLVTMQRREFRAPGDDWPMSVLVVHPGDERPHVIRLPGWVSNDDDMKAAWGQALAAATRITKPVMVALVQSCWLAKALPDEPDPMRPRLMPRDRPDREERMLIIVADTEIEQVHFAEIKRRRRKPPALGPWKHEEVDSVGGRLFDPLRQALR